MKPVRVSIAFLLAWLSLPGPLLAQDTATIPSSPEYFERHIAPVLKSRCLACHGPLRQRGGLRLDSRQALLLGGSTGAAIVPGQADASLLIAAVKREDGLEMPPPAPLAPQHIERLAAWIDAGAPWPVDETSAPQATIITARDVPKATLGPLLTAGPAPSFNHEVRPVLARHCFECHGPDPSSRQAGLRLDTEEGATATLPSGRRAIVPGDPEASQLMHRIAAHAAEDRMPPFERAHGGENPLSPQEIATLARFIKSGAEYQPHWAFVPPERTAPPVSSKHPEWARSPIDQFVLARLEQVGLEPSSEASKRTLLRRLSLDLTGLPPSPGETESFLEDQTQRAYERQVDRLLNSPRYGEHAARHWLDAARYADTNGYHIDNERFMWPWRDWVVRAFNRNQPFDQFTLEQLAGDLLDEPTREQLIATGFHRNHMINFEGGAIPEEYRTQYVFDRTDTTATVWLGLTAECAKCHDHKFDPISQREYYQLSAFFNQVDEDGLDGQTGNARPHLPAPDREQAAREQALLDELAPLYSLLDDDHAQLDQEMATWREAWQERLAKDWQVLAPQDLTSEGGASFEPQEDGSVLVTGENPDTDVITFEAALDAFPAGQVLALRIEALRDTSLPGGGIGRSPGDGTFTLTDLKFESSGDGIFTGDSLPFAFGLADHRHPATPVAFAIDEDESTGWSADFAGKETKRTAVFLLEQPAGVTPGARVRVQLHHKSTFTKRTIGRFRISVSGAHAMTLSQRSAWLWNGPYESWSAASSRLASSSIASWRPKPSDLTKRDKRGRARWVKLPARGGEPVWKTELTLPAGIHRLYQQLHAPSERVLSYRVAADGFRVWLGDQLIDECRPDRASATATNARDCRDETVSLTLQEGKNDLYAEVLLSPNDSGPNNADANQSLASQTFAPQTVPPLRFQLEQESVGTLPFALESLLNTVDSQLTEDQQTQLRRHYRRNHWPRFKREEERFVNLEESLAALREDIPTTMVMSDREEPRPTFLLKRGQYDLHGEKVDATTPAVLPPLPNADGSAANRLDLARWLISDHNPLTARVTVNRIWQQLFGTGLVKTSEDFGTQGELPSHPDLLDWLAVDFRESGWDVKALIRQIVLSQTYRQSSRVTPELLERDPENRLLARASRFRLDAEVIRDSALAHAGLLVEHQGGPGVNPYQPPGLWKEIGYESDGRFSAGEFIQGTGEDLYRRSLYTFWKRTVPPPNMLVFDAPNRETCTVRRGRSNTPLQALTLLNDPQYVEAARALAEHVLEDKTAGKDDHARLKRAFERVLARAPTPSELETLEALLQSQREHFRSQPEAAEALLSVGERPHRKMNPAELASWSQVASVLLNLDEAMTRQ